MQRALLLAGVAMIGVLRPSAETRAERAARQTGRSPEERAVRGLLARQATRFPAMEPQDVYKLMFQATMGARHAGLDSAMAAAWLEREIAALGPGPEEPLVDTISADGRLVRVNLRPFLAAGGDRAALAAAFLRTAREFRGSTSVLRHQVAIAERMAEAGLLPVGRPALHRYVETMRSRGYPAVEHSSGYEAAYRPAYRVVLSALVPR